MKKVSKVFRGILLVAAIAAMALQLTGCGAVKDVLSGILNKEEPLELQGAISIPDASQAVDEFADSVIGSVETPVIDSDSVQQIIGSIDSEALFEGLEGVIVNGDTDSMQSVIIQGVEGFDNAISIIGGNANSCVKDGAFTSPNRAVAERLSQGLQGYSVDLEESGFGEVIYTVSDRWNDELCARIKILYDKNDGMTTGVALYAVTNSGSYDKAKFMDIACYVCAVIDTSLDYDSAADLLENAKSVQSASGETVQAAIHNQMQYVISSADGLIMLYIN